MTTFTKPGMVSIHGHLCDVSSISIQISCAIGAFHFQRNAEICGFGYPRLSDWHILSQSSLLHRLLQPVYILEVPSQPQRI